MRDSGDRPGDPNPIVDEGLQTSTGLISSAISLCEVLINTFHANRAYRFYERGWVLEFGGE